MEPNSETKPELAPIGESTAGGVPFWPAPLLIAMFTLAAFFPTLAERQFLAALGERGLIADNQKCRGLGWENVTWAFEQDSAEATRQYHPLVWLSYGVDSLLYKDAARGYLATNVLLHFLSALLVYFIAARLFMAAGTGRPEAPGSGKVGLRLGALLAGLLFAVHPLRLESVAWLVERRDVLCGFFFLASILTYLRYRDLSVPLSDDDPLMRKPGRPRLWLTVSVVLALAAVLSKATAVCLPLVLLVLDMYPLHESAKRIRGRGWDLAPYFVVALMGFITALQAFETAADARAQEILESRSEEIRFILATQQSGDAAPDPARVTDAQVQTRAKELARNELFPGPKDWKTRSVMALNGSVVLLGKMVRPTGLLPLYEPPVDAAWNASKNTLIGASVAVAITVVLLALKRVWPAGVATWLCYMVLLLPVAGLVRIGVPIEADRHSYLPGIAWAVFLGAGLWVLTRRREEAPGIRPVGGLGIVVGTLVVLTLTGLTFKKARAWRSDKALWAHAVEIQPDDWRAHASLALLLRRENKLEEAERSYVRAHELNPDAWEVCNNLGQVLSLRGKLEAALEYFRKAKEMNPATLAPRQNIWTNLFLLGRIEEAEAELKDTLVRLPEGDAPELKQFRARALNDLGAIYYRQGKYDEAIENFRQSLALFPLFPTAQQGLGDAWLAKGEVAQAAAHYEEALRMNPNDQVVREKLLALRGEQAPDAAGQPPMDPQAAEEMRRRAAESLNRRREALAADPDDPQAHYEMGLILAQMGQLEQSISHLRQAITIKPDLAGAYYHLTAVFLRTNRAAEAEATARQGLAQLPEETSLMGLLAHVLATSNDPQVVAPAEALEWAEKAVQRKPDDASLLEVKGVALAANERFNEALEVLAEAKARAEATGNSILVEKVIRLIEIYEQRRGEQPGTPAGAEEANE